MKKIPGLHCLHTVPCLLGSALALPGKSLSMDDRANSHIDDHNLVAVVLAVVVCSCRTKLVPGKNADPKNKLSWL